MDDEDCIQVFRTCEKNQTMTYRTQIFQNMLLKEVSLEPVNERHLKEFIEMHSSVYNSVLSVAYPGVVGGAGLLRGCRVCAGACRRSSGQSPQHVLYPADRGSDSGTQRSSGAPRAARQDRPGRALQVHPPRHQPKHQHRTG